MSLSSDPSISSADPLVKPPKSKRGMSRNQKILFFVTGWLIVLMPFLFWWNTWFGRHLSDQQLNEYLHDDKKPRHIQHALVQLGDRMSHADANAKRWYPDLIVLATNPVEEVRNTDAWVMGQDISAPGFHETLLKMLADPSPVVRGKLAPSASSQILEIRSPIPGRIRSVAQTGTSLRQGSELAVIDPATEQVWEALRALYLIGQPEDIPSIQPYERDLPDISNDVRQQAEQTDKAIRARSEK